MIRFGVVCNPGCVSAKRLLHPSLLFFTVNPVGKKRPSITQKTTENRPVNYNRERQHMYNDLNERQTGCLLVI